MPAMESKALRITVSSASLNAFSKIGAVISGAGGSEANPCAAAPRTFASGSFSIATNFSVVSRRRSLSSGWTLANAQRLTVASILSSLFVFARIVTASASASRCTAEGISPSPQALSMGPVRCSATMTDNPARAQLIAVASPAGPPPTTRNVNGSHRVGWSGRPRPARRSRTAAGP